MFFNDRVRYICSVVLLILFLTWVSGSLGWLGYAMMGWPFWTTFTVACVWWAMAWVTYLWWDERSYVLKETWRNPT